MNKPQLKTTYRLTKPEENTNTGIIVKFTHNGYKYPVIEEKLITFTQKDYNKHIRNIIEKTLETAAKKAIMKLLIDEENDIIEEAIIDKESITNTLEQTFEKFKI